VATELDCPAPGVKALPLVRWAALLALLVAEVVLLTLRFDMEVIRQEPGAWAAVLRPAPLLLRLAIAVGAATLLLGGRSLGEELRQGAGTDGGLARGWPFLLGHLALLGAFAGLTGLLLGGGGAALPFPLAAAVAWWLVGGAALALWGLAALPGRLWLRLLRHGWAGVLLGGAIGLAAWGGGMALTRVWDSLGQATLHVVHGLLRCFYADTVCRPEAFEVGTATFSVEIARQCSGYEGIALIWVFLGTYVVLYRRRLRFPHVLLLFPLGTAVIWLANAVRIAALIAIGTAGWPDVALGGFHSQAGWLAFNAVALGLVAVSGRLPIFARDRDAAPTAAGPAAAYLGPFLVLLAGAMISGALSARFDWLYPLRVVAVAATLVGFRKSYAGLVGPASWTGPALGAATFLVWVALAPVTAGAAGGQAPDLAGLAPAWAATWWACRVLGYVVLVPVAEELAFRGYLTRRLIAADVSAVPLGRFTWLSFLGSSLAFGALHGRFWLPATLAGLLFALALYRRRRLADAVLAHATANALLAGYVVLTGNWALWS
jgi:exosortase E/protease (VPEID-CTERM system)